MQPQTTPDGIRYEDTVGWARCDNLIDGVVAARLAVACDEAASHLSERLPGDKPHGQTRRLTDLGRRLPDTAWVARKLGPIIDQILIDGWRIAEIAYRCPAPGTGHQQLHADDAPRLDEIAPYTGATAIVALVDFTTTNGATRLVPGSHRRVDRQRLSQDVDHLPDELYLTGPAGTAFVFNRHVLHAGSTNRSNQPRPALQISFRATSN